MENEELKVEEVKEEENVEVEGNEVGEVLELTADENNPVSDGLEYKEGEEHE